MEKFIKHFTNQLEDINIELTPSVDYVNSEFWDSLTAVTIQIMIEEEYDLKIELNLLSEFNSIQELFEFITKK